MTTRTVFNIPFEVTTLDSSIDRIVAMALQKKAASVRLVNAFSVVSAHENDAYMSVMNNGGLNLPDGKPVVWALNASSRSADRAGRVRGPSLFPGVLAAGRAFNLRHYFVGTTDGTLSRLVNSITGSVPGVRIAGSYAPPFTSDAGQLLELVSRQLGEVEVDIVWVALGTPKQDMVSAELADQVGVPVIGVGAAFDFLAGDVAEAPRFLQNSGFEWLYRLSQDPRRLWRRYTFGNLKFARLALASLAGGLRR